MHRLGVAQVVSVDGVNRQAALQGRLDCLRADEVAAVNDGFGPHFLCGGHRPGDGISAIVAVGDDANFHGRNYIGVFGRDGVAASIGR